MNWFSVVGPPGCGKTEFLSHEAARAADAYGGHAVAITSLTRTAAAEIRNRIDAEAIPPDNAGTLHSMCWRALDRPDIAELHVGEWNEEHPIYAVSGGGDVDEVTGEWVRDAAGDEFLSKMNILRQRQIPRDQWPVDVAHFADLWLGWLDETGRLDFTGLIEHALADVYMAPGGPLALLADEAQDYSPLEMALMRKWAEHTETAVWVYDPWQQIYDWRGADCSWLVGLPPEQKRRLKLSYRVPRAVHAAAMAWMGDYDIRVEYEPRDADGGVEAIDATWVYPEPMLPIIEAVIDAKRTIMILASCEFMLGPTLAVLRREGIPFHNPYRTKHGGWNPLLPRKKSVTSPARILAYTRPGLAWTADDVRKWAEPLRSRDVLAMGAKAKLDEFDGSYDALMELFVSPEVAAKATEQDLDWYLSAVLASKRKPLEFPVAIAKRRGRELLEHVPRVIVGTIHSTKGGEADEVVLFPDVSRAAMQQWLEPEGRRSVKRVFYVGLTRARERLWLAGPASGMSMSLQ